MRDVARPKFSRIVARVVASTVVAGLFAIAGPAVSAAVSAVTTGAGDRGAVPVQAPERVFLAEDGEDVNWTSKGLQ